MYLKKHEPLFQKLNGLQNQGQENHSRSVNDFVFLNQVLPIVVFFSTVMSMLYHLGIMQWLVGKVGIVTSRFSFA